MPRKLFIVIAAVVALHIGEVLLLGTTPAGSLVANALQTFSSGLAAAMCLGASRRDRGFGHLFWLLLGCGMTMWGVANLGWTYHELWFGALPPAGSPVRFLFDTHAMFFAMALSLNQEKDSPRIDLEELFDFLQILIIFFFLYLGFYYVPALQNAGRGALAREIWITAAEDAALVALAVFQAARARSQHVRTLYRGMALYLAIYTLGVGFVSYIQFVRQRPTGTWFDLAWTLPFLFASFWAANWMPSAETRPARVPGTKSFGELLMANTTFVLAPIIILFQVAQLGPGWKLLRFSLLSLSILCYAARFSVSEYRQRKSSETVHLQMLAMDSAVDGIAILDPQEVHIYVNAAFARMMGFENPGTLLGKHWRAAYDPQDIQRHEKPIRDSVSRHGEWSGQLYIRRRDGKSFPLEMTVTALPDGGTVYVGRDITERRKAEEARAEAEAKYRMLVEQVAAISYIAEPGIDGQWFYVSPQIETILGYSQREWIEGSRNWIRFVPPDDRPMVKEAEEAGLRGAPYQAEFRIRRKDGREIWVNDTAVVVHGSDGRPVMEGIMVDITERKQLEAQLQQSRRMEAVGRLAGGIAHDFNNLLTIIKGYTELALDRARNQPELRNDIERIEDASERATSLVQQLLAFGRKQVLQPKALDLNNIVLGLDKLLRRLMNENIEMVTLPGETLWSVKADPAQIEQVLMNLVINARDAMPHGGRLTLQTANVEMDQGCTPEHATTLPGSYVMLAVSDTGIGMDAETVAHIFEPFYTTKESGHRTGLGLATVYGIVKQSGGTIWVDSEPGRGTTLKVYLPRINEPAQTLPAKGKETSSQNGAETILLVEDDEAVRELAHMVLITRGYSVLAAESPEDAERLCESRNGKIHLLLTDVIMPGMSGHELAKRITARFPKIKVLYMSGYTDNVIAQGGLLEEGVSFLQKPFTPAKLTDKVRDVLDSPGR